LNRQTTFRPRHYGDIATVPTPAMAFRQRTKRWEPTSSNSSSRSNINRVVECIARMTVRTRDGKIRQIDEQGNAVGLPVASDGTTPGCGENPRVNGTRKHSHVSIDDASLTGTRRRVILQRNLKLLVILLSVCVPADRSWSLEVMLGWEYNFSAMFRIRDILVPTEPDPGLWILGSVHLIYVSGSGSGCCSFCQCLPRCPKNKVFLICFAYYFL
jgi:hypothetical protein